MKKQQKTQGSILAYSLIVLAMMFAIVGSMSVVTVLENKSAGSSQSSAQSFQLADSGVQLAIKKINAVLLNSMSGTNTISSAFNSCSIVDGIPTVTGLTDAGTTGSYDLSFYNKDGDKITKTDGSPLSLCSDALASSIGSVKSVGTYKNTVRAVSVAIGTACGGDVKDLNFADNGLTYGTVVGADGKCWLDRNLGATAVASAYDTQKAYGWLFQWGRSADGHQYTAWGGQPSPALSLAVAGPSATSTVASPNNVKFLTDLTSSYKYDWLSPQLDKLWEGVAAFNNPCPTGFRLPTQPEWDAIVTAAGITNYTTAASSALHLPAAGNRNYDGKLNLQGSYGFYWSSTTFTTFAYNLIIYSSGETPANYHGRVYGFSVRCLKN